jgi:hypothetical protein
MSTVSECSILCRRGSEESVAEMDCHGQHGGCHCKKCLANLAIPNSNAATEASNELAISHLEYEATEATNNGPSFVNNEPHAITGDSDHQSTTEQMEASMLTRPATPTPPGSFLSGLSSIVEESSPNSEFPTRTDSLPNHRGYLPDNLHSSPWPFRHTKKLPQAQAQLYSPPRTCEDSEHQRNSRSRPKQIKDDPTKSSRYQNKNIQGNAYVVREPTGTVFELANLSRIELIQKTHQLPISDSNDSQMADHGANAACQHSARQVQSQLSSYKPIQLRPQLRRIQSLVFSDSTQGGNSKSNIQNFEAAGVYIMLAFVEISVISTTASIATLVVKQHDNREIPDSVISWVCSSFVILFISGIALIILYGRQKEKQGILLARVGPGASGGFCGFDALDGLERQSPKVQVQANCHQTSKTCTDGDPPSATPTTPKFSHHPDDNEDEMRSKLSQQRTTETTFSSHEMENIPQSITKASIITELCAGVTASQVETEPESTNQPSRISTQKPTGCKASPIPKASRIADSE